MGAGGEWRASDGRRPRHGGRGVRHGLIGPGFVRRAPHLVKNASMFCRVNIPTVRGITA